MLVVETIAKIRRAHFIQGKSIKQICRELRVSRNTVRKVIRSGATEFSYDRSRVRRPGRIRRSIPGVLNWMICWPTILGILSANA